MKDYSEEVDFIINGSFDDFLLSEEQAKEYKELFNKDYMKTVYEGLGVPKDLYCNTEIKPIKTIKEVKEND